MTMIYTEITQARTMYKAYQPHSYSRWRTWYGACRRLLRDATEQAPYPSERHLSTQIRYEITIFTTGAQPCSCRGQHHLLAPMCR